jgi:hypothetical protein
MTMSDFAFQLTAAGLMLGFLAIVIGLAIWWYRSRSELRFREFEVRHRVLDKFADSAAFLEFARSEEGRRLLLAAPERAPNGRRGGLRLVQVGLLVLSLGIGAAIASAKVVVAKEDPDRYRRENLSTWSTLFICAGISLTVSGALTRWLDRH